MSMDIATASPFARAPMTMWRRFVDSYLGRSVLSPFHAAMAVGLVAVSILAQSVVPLLCGVPLAEALFFIALPRWSFFRHFVDRGRRAREGAARDAFRRAQLSRMREEHRVHVDALQRIDASMRARLPAIAVDEACIGRLIDLYVEIAIVHDEAKKIVDENVVDEDTAPEMTSPETSDLSEHRRARRDLAMCHLECRRDNQERLAVLREQLEVIETAVKLLRERTILARDDEAIAAKVKELLDEIDESAPVVQSLIALSAELHRRA